VSKAPASSLLLAKVERLFNKAISGAPLATIAPIFEEKLFELYVLGKLLSAYKKKHPAATISLEGVSPGGTITVPGSAASADKAKFSYFKIVDGDEHLEGWISVQVKTLSWKLSGSPAIVPPAGRHELDVAIFKGPLTTAQPTFQHLVVGVSCKHVKKSGKENLREALGLRRETAYLACPRTSNVPWLVPRIPADPASAFFFISSDPGCRKYRSPVNEIGLYVRYLRFPV
jgi:hypothetical protein